jgi:hypothetical protein
MAQFIDNIKEICNLKDFNPLGIKIFKYVYSVEEIIKTNNYPLSKVVFKSTFGEPGKIYIYFDKINILLDAINSNNNNLIYLVLSYYNLHIIYKNMDDILCCLIRNSNFEVCKTILYNYNITFKDNAELYYYNYDEDYDNLKYKTKINYSPLYCAVTSGNFKFVKLLLKLGADPNVWSNINGGYHQGKLPLHAAIKNNNYKIAKLLVLNGANPNLSINIIDYDIYDDPITHYSPLHYAIRDYKIKFIKLFKYYYKSITNDEYLELKKEKKNLIKFISDYTECQYNLLDKYD